MCFLTVFVISVYCVLIYRFQVKKIQIILFHGTPLAIPTWNDRPDFSQFDVAIRKEVKEAWEQYLSDVDSMNGAIVV